MADHYLKLRPQSLQRISVGTKTVEGRLASRNTRSIQPGDTLIFNDGALICDVLRCTEYATSGELIARETASALGFTNADVALAAYQKIYWYAKDRPVLAIVLTPIFAQQATLFAPTYSKVTTPR